MVEGSDGNGNRNESKASKERREEDEGMGEEGRLKRGVRRQGGSGETR